MKKNHKLQINYITAKANVFFVSLQKYFYYA